jgi:hypothetical protein
MLFVHRPITNGEAGPQVFRGKDFTHLMADSEQELRAYAASVGIPEKWIQRAGTPRVHFDVTGCWLKFVLQDPRVTKLTLREWAVKVSPKSSTEKTTC